MQPLAGVVFALDGVLMGAGDVGYLRTVTIGSAVVGFLPLSLLSVPLAWGLAGVWTGLTLFIVLRLVGGPRPGGRVALAGRAGGERRVSRRGRPTPTSRPSVLLVDKPAGMTSHDVVARARRLLSVRRIGHAGTLDPMATGLLVLGVGAATRLLGHLAGHDKTYEATIRLGQSTVTDDREGEVRRRRRPRRTCPTTTSAPRWPRRPAPLQQVPSSVSAVKVAGRRSYDRVRAGEEVELAPRAVTVHRHRRPPDRPARRPTWSTST